MTARIVLFDLGNVVVDWQPFLLYREFFETDAQTHTFLQTVCTMEWHLAHDSGVPMPENAKHLIAKYPHYEAEILAWQNRWLDMFAGYVPGVPTLMARLEEARIPLYGLSNIPADVADETFDAFR